MDNLSDRLLQPALHVQSYLLFDGSGRQGQQFAEHEI